jgi:hypothetical protein
MSLLLSNNYWTMAFWSKVRHAGQWWRTTPWRLKVEMIRCWGELHFLWLEQRVGRKARTGWRLRQASHLPEPTQPPTFPPSDLIRQFHLAERHQWPTSNCLRNALVLHAMMRRQGYAASLHVGVTKAQGFRAHAWVCLAEEVLLQDPAALKAYTPLDLGSQEKQP